LFAPMFSLLDAFPVIVTHLKFLADIQAKVNP